MNTLNKFYIKDKYSISNKEIMPLGVKMSGAYYEWKETMGEGIKIGVIDTGADLKHIDLKDRIADFKNFTDEKGYDNNGHGTHVCGTVAATKNNKGVVGVAPLSSLYIAKAFNRFGVSSDEAVINSIHWLIEKKVDVINMSFSSDSYTEEYYDAMKAAYNSGITLVAAAGNEGVKGVGYPGKFKEVLCVSAVNPDKMKASFSSVGNDVDVCAVGTNVLSTYPDNTYALLSGTSMATPIITGCCAIMQGKSVRRFKNRLSPEKMKLLMCMYSDDLGKYGKDINFGFGLFSFGRLL